MELLEIVKWPLCALLVVVVLRKALSELILNIADFAITKDGVTARIARPSSAVKREGVGENRKQAGGITKINEKYFSQNNEGEVFFNYSNNNGVYTIGEKEYRFDTQWSKASNTSIHFYNDQPTIRSVMLSKDASALEDIDPKRYDSSSRARTAGVNEVAIFENINGKYLLVKILGLKDDSRGDTVDELHFKYKIID